MERNEGLNYETEHILVNRQESCRLWLGQANFVSHSHPHLHSILCQIHHVCNHFSILRKSFSSSKERRRTGISISMINKA